MDLKSGEFLWPHLSKSRLPFKKLGRDIRCDVAVIGAGLSGAMTAHALAKRGLDVVVLDRRIPGTGSTSASTALVLYEVDVPLIDLAEMRGEREAVRCYEACRNAIDRLARLNKELGGGCGFRRRGSFYKTDNKRSLPRLVREFEARRKAGFDVEYLNPAEIGKRFSFSALGAIYSTEAAEVDPLALTRLLLERCLEYGTRIFSETEVTHIGENVSGTTLRTASGKRVFARWTVCASGFETHAPEVRKIVKLQSSYALATKPVGSFPGWPGRCLIWETRRPYLYLRTSADSRIIAGGEDEEFVDPRKRDRLIPEKSAILAAKCRELFPGIPIEPDFCWAGTFGETKDGLPYVGPLKPGSRILYALCYGANGTNFAVLAAGIVRDLILRKANPEAALFGFDR